MHGSFPIEPAVVARRPLPRPRWIGGRHVALAILAAAIIMIPVHAPSDIGGDPRVSQAPRAVVQASRRPAPRPMTRAGSVAASAAVWSGAADRGFGAWGLIQDGLHDSQYGASSISIADAPFVSGRKAFRFQVDGTSAANGPRAELADTFQLTEGSEWWFGDVLYIPSSNSGQWRDGHHTLMQFKNAGTGSPPLELDLREWHNSSSGLGVSDNNGWRQIVPMSQIYDRPIAIEIRVRFSADASKGQYEIWVNGSQVVAPKSVATLRPGLTSGLKEGQYGEGTGNVVYWLGAKRGTSRASVQQ